MKKKTLYLHGPAAEDSPSLSRRYDGRFKATAAYRASLPDLMAAEGTIQGARVPIQQVGVAGFRLPLRFRTRRGEVLTLETRVTGTVSVEAHLKGINMSRLVRSFYEHREAVFTLERLASVLRSYRRKVGALAAQVRLDFSYPLAQRSLRSDLEGYQFYDASLEGTMDEQGNFRKFLGLDFIYASACPCSAELSEHARVERGVYGIPHSQRSKARVRLEVAPGARLAIEEVVAHCRQALQTEVQVMVKREDEQAFAELNGAHVKFVEDAARLLYERLAGDARIHDFQIVCSHQESLHPYDAVSVICKGVPGGFVATGVDFRALQA